MLEKSDIHIHESVSHWHQQVKSEEKLLQIVENTSHIRMSY